MATHILKTWPAYFERLLDGTKTFEVRKDDRGYQMGDILDLREWVPATSMVRSTFTGRSVRFRVGFVFRQGVGVDLGEYVVMSLLPERRGTDDVTG